MPISTKLTQGKNCMIHPEALLGYKEHGGKIVLGDNVSINKDVLLRTCTGIIKIGTESSVGYGVIIHALGGVNIGEKTMLSPRVQIYAQNHGMALGKPMIYQPQIADGVSIGNNCWIGAGVIICDGVTIENGCVIGAGSIVTRGRYKANGIYAGNPCKKIGERK